jgi:hypothetical protein
MRIGFVSLYSWRPHVSNMVYLANLLKDSGHHVSFLTCDGSLSQCSSKALHLNDPHFITCTGCILAGFRSYKIDNIHSIKKLNNNKIKILDHQKKEWSASSAFSINRFESEDEILTNEFQILSESFYEPLEQVFSATFNWIKHENLEAILLFNGRIDITRAVIEASKKMRINYVSIERPWFGNGLWMLPNENCLGLKAVKKINSYWSNRPLKYWQAAKAAKIGASRFTKSNHQEWRVYNQKAQATKWPIKNSRFKFLILPSSTYETWGHEDWKSQWQTVLEGIDFLICHLKLQPSDFVLRCHPNWALKIGSFSGHKSEQYYCDWANKNQIRIIYSKDNASTLDLIEQSDAVIVTGGSAAIDAGMLGKQIIAISPSFYQGGNFFTKAYSKTDVLKIIINASLSNKEREFHKNKIIQNTIRFLYTFNFRIPQFEKYIRSESATHSIYYQGADSNKLIAMLKQAKLEVDDNDFSEDSIEEDQILDLVKKRDWINISKLSLVEKKNPPKKIKQKLFFRILTYPRKFIPRGDERA